MWKEGYFSARNIFNFILILTLSIPKSLLHFKRYLANILSQHMINQPYHSAHWSDSQMWMFKIVLRNPYLDIILAVISPLKVPKWARICIPVLKLLTYLGNSEEVTLFCVSVSVWKTFAKWNNVAIKHCIAPVSRSILINSRLEDCLWVHLLLLFFFLQCSEIEKAFSHSQRSFISNLTIYSGQQ